MATASVGTAGVDYDLTVDLVSIAVVEACTDVPVINGAGTITGDTTDSLSALHDAFTSPIVVQVPHEDGPFGAKGAGETGASELGLSGRQAVRLHGGRGVEDRGGWHARTITGPGPLSNPRRGPSPCTGPPSG